MLYATLTSVLTGASSYDLITLADVKDDWGITKTADDNFLKRSITRCSAAAAQYCNRVFPLEKVIDTFIVERDEQPGIFRFGLDKLKLSRWPVGTITSVIQAGVSVPLVSGTDYLCDEDKGLLIRLLPTGAPTTWEPLTVVVTYEGGYGPEEIPSDIKDAISRMVYTRYTERKRDPLVKSSFIDGVERIEYLDASTTGNLDPGTEDILNNYRALAIA